MIQLIHATSQRGRYQVRSLYRSTAMQQYLETRLKKRDGIDRAAANPLTGNVLVTFDRAALDAHQVASMLEAIATDYQAESQAQSAESPESSETPESRQDRSAHKGRKKGQKATEGQEDQPEKDWFRLEPDEILTELNTSEDGLSGDAVEGVRDRFGSNALQEAEPRSDWSILVGQFNSLPVALLGAAAGLSVVTGGFADAVVILGVVGVNAAIGFFTESQSERIIQSLEEGGEQTASVLRDGDERQIDADEVVPGDILLLQAGQPVAADVRLLAADNLSIDESALTGESVPVTKRIKTLEGDVPLAERVNMAFKGTFVTSGSGRGVVVTTGRFTEVGQIQTMVGEAEGTDTPLQAQLDEVGSQLVMLGGGICAGVFGLGLLRGYGLLPMLKTSISLAVASVPEGLPTIATTTLALGIQDMRKRHILVRDLNAVEALGSVQTICLDKTGTITRNKMEVQAVYLADGGLRLEGDRFFPTNRLDEDTDSDAPQGEDTDRENTGSEHPDSENSGLENAASEHIENSDPAADAEDQADRSAHDEQAVAVGDRPDLEKLIKVCALCSESDVEPGENDEYDLQGSSTENALIEMAIAAGFDVPDLRQQHPTEKMLLRTENRNVMTTIHSAEEGYFVAVKGSPAEVLERCTQWVRDGETVSLTDEDRQQLSLANERMAGQALRVLAVAYRAGDRQEIGDDWDNPDPVERDLIWLGLTGMADPIREGVRELIEGFHRAGIDTAMITGDQSPTAYAIGKSLGLNRDQTLEILDSSQLSQVDAEKLQALCDKVDVFARISPADKLQIVQALQARGQVVAMTGDGINDTPALKAADVGVAMGSGKSGMVRDVADVVIEDDNLGTLIDSVSRGRTIYNNIRKSVHFLLSTNLSEIMVTTVGTAIGVGEPLNAMQLLWLNLVSDIFPGLALALEPPEPDVLDLPPRDPEERIIKPEDFERIVFESAMISLSALGAYTYAVLRYGINSRQASTVIFMSLTIAQILHTLTCRSQTHSLFDKEKLPRNPYVDGAIVGSIGLQLLPAAIPFLRDLLQLTPVDALDLLVIATSAALPLVINESTKPKSEKGDRSRPSKDQAQSDSPAHADTAANPSPDQPTFQGAGA
ncbi:MAG: HAD-IC family P-type ATPase [Synechococcales bacterium]|nr:HAD-IC family P-type ATPase [Synechococcales bacterium]